MWKLHAKTIFESDAALSQLTCSDTFDKTDLVAVEQIDFLGYIHAP